VNSLVKKRFPTCICSGVGVVVNSRLPYLGYLHAVNVIYPDLKGKRAHGLHGKDRAMSTKKLHSNGLIA